jgi:hypothetical protein
MLKRNYYYLVAGLQDLSPDIPKLLLDPVAFREVLKNGVYPSDFRLVATLYYPYDNKNLLSLLLNDGQPFDERGMLPTDQLVEGLREPDLLYPYMAEFVKAFRSQEPLFPDMSPENELTTLYYRAMLETPNHFLREWFRFSLTLKNLLTAFIHRKHNLSPEHQIIGEDEVSMAIRRSHLRDFGLGHDIDYIESVANLVAISDFTAREKGIDQLFWDYLEEETFFHYFTIERLLAYVIKTQIAARWLTLDPVYAQSLFDKMMKELTAGYQLPQTFTDKK